MANTSQPMSKLAAQYTAFVKKSLRNSKIDFLRRNAERLNTEIPFSEFWGGQSEEYADEFAADVIDAVSSMFMAANYAVEIKNELLSDALEQLDEPTRSTVLLTEGLDMSDREAGEELEISTRLANKKHRNGLKALKKAMGGKQDGQDD